MLSRRFQRSSDLGASQVRREFRVDEAGVGRTAVESGVNPAFTRYS